jgi:hypothetical protein
MRVSLACGLVLGLLLPPLAAQAGWLITGTTTTFDNLTPVPNVQVTLFPESLTVVTDAQGDFLIPWSGARSYLKLVATEKNKDGTTSCRRIALQPRAKTKADSTYDVGVIVFVPNAYLPETPWAMRPRELTPQRTFKFPPAAPGQRDTCDFTMRVVSDMWGQILEIKQTKGDQQPARILEAADKWLRSLPWTVQRESRCDLKNPFTAAERFTYVSSDSGWVYVPKYKPRGSERGR